MIKQAALFFCLGLIACKTTSPDSGTAKGIVTGDTNSQRMIKSTRRATYYWADAARVYAISCGSVDDLDNAPDTFLTLNECKARFKNTLRSLAIGEFKQSAIQVVTKNQFVKERFEDRKALDDFGGAYFRDLEMSIETSRSSLNQSEYNELIKKMNYQKSLYSQALTSRPAPAPTSDPETYVSMLIQALQRPEEITIADTQTEPNVDLHAAVVNGVMNRLLPDSIRGKQKALVCWDNYVLLVVGLDTQCSDFGFDLGEAESLRRRDREFLENLEITEIQKSVDDQTIWGGGYLLEIKGGMAFFTVPVRGERIARINLLRKDQVNPRSQAAGRFCSRRYPGFYGEAVRCGL
jgi:hypothetical protein